MGLRKAAPGEGGKKGHTHFGYVGCMPGKMWDAWIAGPCYWCLAHTTGKSKPCLDWISAGCLTCERCNPCRPAEEIGYQPLYRDIDGRPVFVIVHAYSRELVDALKFRQRVRVSRGTDSADAICLQPMLGKQEWYSSTLAERQQPADIALTLLAVWKLPELVKWYHENNPDGAPKCEARTVAVNDDGKPYSPEMQQPARRAGARVTSDPATVAEYDAVLARLQQSAKNLAPSTNGNGKKPH